MLRIYKLLASGFIAGALVGQVYAIAPGTDGGWYWPFISYPMYSDAKLPGETFTFRELRAVPCTGGDPILLPPHELGTQYFLYRKLTHRASGEPENENVIDPAVRDAAAAQLDTIVRAQVGREVCELQVWGQTFRIGREGLEDRDPPWTLRRGWEVTLTRETSP